MIKDCILSEKILKLLNKDNKYKSPDDAISLYSGLDSLVFPKYFRAIPERFPRIKKDFLLFMGKY